MSNKANGEISNFEILWFFLKLTKWTLHYYCTIFCIYLFFFFGYYNHIFISEVETTKYRKNNNFRMEFIWIKWWMKCVSLRFMCLYATKELPLIAIPTLLYCWQKHPRICNKIQIFHCVPIFFSSFGFFLWKLQHKLLEQK